MIQFDEDHIVIDRTRIFLFLHVHISILSQTPLPSRLPYNIEQNSLCYILGPCWISILNSIYAAAAAAKSLQSCPTLCNPIDGSPSGATVPGILQARTLEWIAISFSNVWKWKVKVKSDSWWPHGLQPTRLLRPWDFPGKSTGVGCHCLLQNKYLFIAVCTCPSQIL